MFRCVLQCFDVVSYTLCGFCRVFLVFCSVLFCVFWCTVQQLCGFSCVLKCSNELFSALVCSAAISCVLGSSFVMGIFVLFLCVLIHSMACSVFLCTFVLFSCVPLLSFVIMYPGTSSILGSQESTLSSICSLLFFNWFLVFFCLHS